MTELEKFMDKVAEERGECKREVFSKANYIKACVESIFEDCSDFSVNNLDFIQYLIRLCGILDKCGEDLVNLRDDINKL